MIADDLKHTINEPPTAFVFGVQVNQIAFERLALEEQTIALPSKPGYFLILLEDLSGEVSHRFFF